MDADYKQIGSRLVQQLNIGFQGVPGSFSEQALYEYFGDEVLAEPVKDFEDIFKALNNDDIDYGILPIENSYTGAISQVYDLLNKYNNYIVGEICIQISQNLLGIEGSSIEDISEVYSHPQGFEQCRDFLKNHNDWKLVPYHNTAISAEYVKKENRKSYAAIASKKASKLYNLDILMENINSSTDNYTRFAIIGRNIEVDDDSNKISVVLSTQHKPGCLFNVLRYFAENNINMLKIESRPRLNKPWEYLFYIDYEGSLNDEKIKGVTDLIKVSSCYFKLLGNYKAYK